MARYTKIDLYYIMAATAFATEAHAGQTRKFTNDPYIIHPIALAEILTDWEESFDIICAALLHDTVEDTGITIDDIKHNFGAMVAMIVEGVTELPNIQGNRATRKQIQAQHYASQPAVCQTIKLLDLHHNLTSMVEHDPEFVAKRYLPEKINLAYLLDKGDPRAQILAWETIVECKRKLAALGF